MISTGSFGKIRLFSDLLLLTSNQWHLNEGRKTGLVGAIHQNGLLLN